MDEHSARGESLAHWMVDGDGWTRRDVFIVDIRRDAHDAARFGSDADELHHRIHPHDVPVERILIGEHPFRKRLADDDHLLAILTVAFIEVTARDNARAQ